MTQEEFVKTGVAVLDSLTGTEENLKAPWTLGSGANNIGKRTATGATTQTEKKQAGAVWGGAYVKSAQFLVGGKFAVLPGETGQVVNFVMGLEGGTTAEVFFVKEAGSLAYIGLELEGVEIAGGKEKTLVVGDSYYLVCFENKMNVCRITSAGVYSVLYSALGSNTKKGIEPRWVFEPTSTLGSKIFRLTEFKAGGAEEHKTVEIKSTMVATATLTANLTRTRILKSTMVATGTLTAKLTRTRIIKSAMSAIATLTAKLETSGAPKTVEIRSTMTATGTMTAKLIRTRILRSAMGATGALSAKLVRTRIIRSAMSAAATLSARLETSKPFGIEISDPQTFPWGTVVSLYLDPHIGDIRDLGYETAPVTRFLGPVVTEATVGEDEVARFTGKGVEAEVDYLAVATVAGEERLVRVRVSKA